MTNELVIDHPESAAAESTVEVPVAADGSAFLPSCGTSRSYTVGRKGSEVHFRDYFEALAALRQMQRPHWRRANGRGRRGIVVGVDWRRLPRTEIEALALTQRMRMG